jgi:hypothetical protein
MSGVQLGDSILAVDGVLVSDQTTAEKMKGAGLRMTLVFGRTQQGLAPSPGKDPLLEVAHGVATSPRMSNDIRTSGGPIYGHQVDSVHNNKREHPSPKKEAAPKELEKLERRLGGKPDTEVILPLGKGANASRVPLRNLIRGTRGPVESWFWNTVGGSAGNKGQSGAFATIKPPSFGRSAVFLDCPLDIPYPQKEALLQSLGRWAEAQEEHFQRQWETVSDGVTLDQPSSTAASIAGLPVQHGATATASRPADPRLYQQWLSFMTGSSTTGVDAAVTRKRGRD